MSLVSRLFNTKTFKFRMTCVVIALVLIAVLLVAGVSLFAAERKMAEVIGDQQYALLSSAAASIDDDLQSKQTVLRTVAERLTEHTARDLAFVQTTFESHSTLREEFFNVVAFDPKGRLIANLGDRSAIGSINVTKRDYFQDTLNAREGVISAPFKSTLSGKPVVLITEPVFDSSGKLRFMIAGVMDLGRPRLFAQLDALKPGKTGYLFLLTNQGLVLQHPVRANVLTTVGTAQGIGRMFHAMRSTDGWTRGVEQNGASAIWTFHRLRKAEWIVGASYPESEAFTPLTSMRQTSYVATAFVALGAGIAGWLAVWRLLRPLGALRKHISKITSGHSKISVFDVQRKDEFGELSRAFYVLSQEREKAESDLAAIAKTDMLTGINNRRMFDEALAAAIGRASRDNTIIGLAYLDVDHFKTINDTRGHGAGDEVLIEFAARLKRTVRISDTVARLAGDEFVIIFEQLADEAVPYAIAEKIIAAILEPFHLTGGVINATTSIGIALREAKRITPIEMLAAADSALYQAKRAGRNGFSVNHSAQDLLPSD